MIDINEIIELRHEGYTLAEIGQRYGVTRQRIHQILTEGKVKPRRWSKTYQQIPYKGLREYVVNNKYVSITYLSRLLFGTPCHTTDLRVMRMMQGADTQLSISQIKRLEKDSGMPFSYLFQKEGDA